MPLIRNLLFQPITLNTASGSLHLLSRKAVTLSDDQLSPEIQLAEQRGYLRISRDLKPPAAPKNPRKKAAPRSRKRNAV